MADSHSRTELQPRDVCAEKTGEAQRIQGKTDTTC